jgi:hypothetical protein
MRGPMNRLHEAARYQKQGLDCFVAALLAMTLSAKRQDCQSPDFAAQTVLILRRPPKAAVSKDSREEAGANFETVRDYLNADATISPTIATVSVYFAA